MNTIFAVVRTSQGRDGDDWSHWIDHNIHSYYQHKTDAETKIQQLLKEEITELLERAERYQDRPDMVTYYEKTHKQYLSNEMEYLVGTKETEEAPIFYIKDIVVN